MVVLPLRQVPLRRKQKNFGGHEEFLARLTKRLHYGKYSSCDRTSLPVTELVAQIFSRAKGKVSLEFLDVEEAARISRNASISPCSLVLALLYLDRLKASNSKYLAKVPPSQLFLISLMVGSKFLQDDGQDDEVNNWEWATYGGLTVQDINRAEREFLNAIEWEVYVSKEDFWRRLRGMEQLVSLREGCKRGWFSYTELDLLLHSCQLTDLLKTLANISIVCLASYTASVFALLGSTMLVCHIPGIIPYPGIVPLSEVAQLTIPPVSLEPQSVSKFEALTLDMLNKNHSDDEIEPNFAFKSVLESNNCEFNLPRVRNASKYSEESTFGIDFSNLWQLLELNDPVTSWAFRFQKFLKHESAFISVA